MLKKLLSIAYLTLITSLTVCMDRHLDDINRLNTNPSAPCLDEMTSQSLYPQSGTQDLIVLFNRLVNEGDQEKLVAFLKEEHGFADSNLAMILELVYKNDWKEVLASLNDQIIIDQNVLIETALKAGNLKEVQLLTNFNRYVTSPDILDYESYVLDNEKFLKEKCYDIMYEIIIYKGINYAYFNGDRYLQTLIRSGDTQLVMRFIKNSNAKELNKKEGNGSTALHEASFAWDRCVKLTNSPRAPFQKRLIQYLLKHGASPLITNQQQVCPQDLTFFKQHETLCREWQCNYQKAQVVKRQLAETQAQIQSIRRSISPQTKKTFGTRQTYQAPAKELKSSVSLLKLTGCAFIAIGAFYLAHRLLSQRTHDYTVNFNYTR